MADSDPECGGATEKHPLLVSASPKGGCVSSKLITCLAIAATGTLAYGHWHAENTSQLPVVPDAGPAAANDDDNAITPTNHTTTDKTTTPGPANHATPQLVALSAASRGDSAENNKPSLLFVQTSKGAVLTDSTLTLTGISPHTGWFTDRPARGAGQVPTERFLSLWDGGKHSFADDLPNADFTCSVDGTVVNYVVELRNPSLYPSGCNLDHCILSYEITIIGSEAVEEGSKVECDGGMAHLFIDDGGMAHDWCVDYQSQMQLFQECVNEPTMYG